MKTTPQDDRERKKKPGALQERRARQATGQPQAQGANQAPRRSQATVDKQAPGKSNQRRKVIRSPWKRWRWVIVAAVVALVALVVVLLVRQPQAQNGDIPGVMTYNVASRQHVTTQVAYAQNPPVGGDHNPVWQNCGIYSQPLINEHAVHSLEHGAVWITYQTDLDSASVAQLQNLVRGHSYALLSPYVGLPSKVVISAWGVQLKVNSASDPRLAQFVSKYEQGPQTQEPGAACSGGFGTPDEH